MRTNQAMLHSMNNNSFFTPLFRALTAAVACDFDSAVVLESNHLLYLKLSIANLKVLPTTFYSIFPFCFFTLLFLNMRNEKFLIKKYLLL